jgi:pyridoxal 5-phosphate dependent beta-lyase
LIHLDSAAAGRQSEATLAAAAAHARLETETGAYVAQEKAAETIEGLRKDLGEVLGVPADGVVFLESATAALVALLDACPLPAGSPVGIVAAEWGPNLEQLAWHGLRPVELATDGGGRLDLEALEHRLAADPPALVHLTQVTSHRALVQPVAEAAALCRAAGVPLWVDAAQALGHVDVASGADAVYGTSRKWLAGPRGVGILAVPRRSWPQLRVLRAALVGDVATPRYLESFEAHIAGRLGLANAVREFVEAGPATVYARLAEVGAATRGALADVPGWELADAVGAQAAITAIRPVAGQDVAAERQRLLADHGILTTACALARAPRDMTAPLLRVSPHVDCTEDELARLAAALRS